jgi:hypothetical protein
MRFGSSSEKLAGYWIVEDQSAGMAHNLHNRDDNSWPLTNINFSLWLLHCSELCQHSVAQGHERHFHSIGAMSALTPITTVSRQILKDIPRPPNSASPDD